ncbi:hypothetical protein [Histidinibacterium aquaticum]|uniref:Uncharacterized protein n=1 Tax=Histidinibacterium aquaticum TaxID=2613962 RepID=A0A5J5GD21_9RHOB|nr:hypothetical protein [Histidinibacterium aquaticum]KAA9005672.1 hypothetical protein F3S47_17360 [Histidinibacterium aquaticum]
MNGLIAALLSAAIVGSAFLPWLDIPLLFEATLWEAVRDNAGDIIDGLGTDTGWGVWVFIASFPVAVLSALANLGGLNRIMATLAGALPLAAIGWFVSSVRERMTELLGQVPGGSGEVMDFIGLGFWLYAATALALLLVGLFAGRSRG